MALSSSTTPAMGDVVVSWAGSIANGSGAFSGNFGLSAGLVVANFFTNVASGTEVLRIRSGY